MLVHKQQITLNLIVELIRDLDAADIIWAWLGPLSTNLARVDHVWNHVKHFLGYTHSVKEPFHDMFGCVPPSNMQLPQRKPDGSFSSCISEKSDDFPDVKTSPIVWILGIVSSISPRSPLSWLYVLTSWVLRCSR